MTRLFTLLLMSIALLLPASVAAQERILSYDSLIEVRADGSLDITENIRVRALGNNIRRGIFRDFPTRYTDRLGNRVVVDFEVLGVERDGQPEPWFTERKSNGVRVNTGNDDFLRVPVEYTYTLRYRTTRQLGFFDDHDELYFNAIGTGWEFAIDKGTVEVRLPDPVPVNAMTAEGYSGVQGMQGQDFEAALPAPGIARWTLSRGLQPREGLTVVLSFPKGIIAEPTRQQRMWWLLKDNRGVLIALAGLIVLLVYCLQRWRRVGRDPVPGTIIVRYDPPQGQTPAGLRYMMRMKYDNRCFSSDLLDSAVAGLVRIGRDKKLLKDKWQIERTDAGQASVATAEQHALLASLFPAGKRIVELDNKNASLMQGAIASHTGALKQRFQPSMFQRNSGSVIIAVLITMATALLASLLGGGGGILLIVLIVAAMFAVLVVFAIAIKAPTADGRRLMDEIQGFKRYLAVADKDDLARLPGPQPEQEPTLDAERFERLLPYAVALDVEDAWTDKFTLAVGAAAAAAAASAIHWYHGGGVSDLGSLASSIGGGLSSQIASSSTPPGGSSGGGGGGSSGGGGGGGGGGGR